MKKIEYKYGKPIKEGDLPKPSRRLPEYDECLKEFLDSGHKVWKVSKEALPSKKTRIILSSLKWRTNKKEFRNIKVFMRKNNVYLEKTGT